MKKEQELIMDYKNFCLNYDQGTYIKASVGDIIIEEDYCLIKSKNKINYILDFNFPFSSYTDTDKHPHDFDLDGLKTFLNILKSEADDGGCIIFNRYPCTINGWEWERASGLIITKLVSIMNKVVHYQMEMNGISNISVKNNDGVERLVFLAEIRKDRCVFQIKYDEDESKDITGSAGIIAYSPDRHYYIKEEIIKLLSSIDKSL